MRRKKKPEFTFQQNPGCAVYFPIMNAEKITLIPIKGEIILK